MCRAVAAASPEAMSWLGAKPSPNPPATSDTSLGAPLGQIPLKLRERGDAAEGFGAVVRVGCEEVKERHSVGQPDRGVVHTARVSCPQLLIDLLDQSLVLVGELGFGFVANETFHLAVPPQKSTSVHPPC